jgi:hypothetical protein
MLSFAFFPLLPIAFLSPQVQEKKLAWDGFKIRE